MNLIDAERAEKVKAVANEILTISWENIDRRNSHKLAISCEEQAQRILSVIEQVEIEFFELHHEASLSND